MNIMRAMLIKIIIKFASKSIKIKNNKKQLKQENNMMNMMKK